MRVTPRTGRRVDQPPPLWCPAGASKPTKVGLDDGGHLTKVPLCAVTLDDGRFRQLDAIAHLQGQPFARVGVSAVGLIIGTVELHVLFKRPGLGQLNHGDD